MTNAALDEAPKSRIRRKPLVVLILLIALSQSFTVTLPIDGRIVDEAGQPIGYAEIAALWMVRAWNPVDSPSPAGAVRVSRVISDAQGRFHVPAAFILHTPVVPFSWLIRSNEMPMLAVVADGYRVALRSNDQYGLFGPANSGGF